MSTADSRSPRQTYGVIFPRRFTAYPCHCGFRSERLGHAHLIHAHALRRQVIEEPYAGEWPAKIKFAFRFRGCGI